jgi:ankyrin repeat protein/N-acetylneuraminic acid mutarotase
MKTTIASANRGSRHGRARSPLRATARTECAPYHARLALGLLLAALLALPARAATNDLTSAIQRGLFEEEANQNLGAAIQAYQAVASQFDKDRKLAATAIFRLGECYRKQGNTNEAAVQYERVLREFSDQPTLVTLSRQNLATLGAAPTAPGASAVSEAALKEQKRLLEEEIKLVQKQLESQRRQVEAGVAPSDSVFSTERELLKLRRQLAAFDAGQTASTGAAEAGAGAAAIAEGDRLALEKQIAELKALPNDNLRIAVQQNYPNPVLTSLTQKLTDLEQQLKSLQVQYGPEHPLIASTKAQLETVNKQIDAQIDGALRGLEAKRDVAAKLAKEFRAQTGATFSQGKEAATAPATAASTDADDVRRIQTIIKDSPDLINAPDRKGETLLQAAAANGKLSVVKLLLDSGAAVDGLQQPGLTALHYAAANGHKAVVDLLLSKGAKAGAQTEGGITPLHLTARKGYETVAKALLAAGAPVNARTKAAGKWDSEDLQYYNVGAGATPLHLAASAGYAGLVDLFLAKGAEVNAEDDAGRTALSYAAQKRSGAVLQLLLAAHGDPNAGRFELPLPVATFLGDLPTLKLLLTNGADPNAKTSLSWSFRSSQPQRKPGSVLPTGPLGAEERCTPLSIAVRQQDAGAVRELLAGKADPNLPGPDGASLLFNAISELPTLKALLEGGADPNCLDREGYSPLLRAVISGLQPSVELLLAHKADPDVGRPEAGWTSLHEAVERGNTGIAEALVKGGAAVNAKDKNGWTPLVVAIMRGQREVAALLLANKADPNARDKEGSTPLHYAVGNRKPELAELLLTHKADPNERDNRGRTPLDVAKSIPSPPPPGAIQSYPGQAISVTSAAGGQESKPQTLADLLRQHGALDDLPHLDQIGIRRSSIGLSSVVFTKGAQDWNQFTLLELLAVWYKILAQQPDQAGNYKGGASTFFNSTAVQFPDLAHIHISRPSADRKSWQDQVVDLTPVLAAGECARDVRLRWGEVVEIPEADHPLNEGWRGWSAAELGNLKKCLTRKIEIVVKGQTTAITLAPKITGLDGSQEGGTPVRASSGPRYGIEYEPTIYAETPYWLRPVLLESKLVLISSDLSRVKVTRRDPATGQKREWVVDCSKSGESAPDFWLQDGDRIEVPEKSYTSGSAQAEMPNLSLPAGVRPSSGAASSERPATIAAPEDGRTPVPPVPARTLRAPAAAVPQAPRPPVSPAAPGQPPAPPLAQRLASVVPRLRPAEDQGQYLVVGSLFYSPKAEDGRLLKAGYRKDPSARTRQGEVWEQRATPDLEGRAGNTATWTGSAGHQLIVFGGEGMGTSFGNGARYSLTEDAWALLPPEGEPASRTGHAAVWTGREMIVWGGFGGVAGNDTIHRDGARYGPSTDTWKPLSGKNAPSARFDCPAVWTGREMLLWGGYTDSHSRYQGGHADAQLNTGGRYDPASDSWKAITTRGAPSKRFCHTIVWTGKEMIVWGGGNATKVLGDGGRYNPAKDSWKPISTDGAPSPRMNHVALWTGKEMIIWGGGTREGGPQAEYFENGARYDPDKDSWKPMSGLGAPKGRAQATAVWTGTEMILWGGVNDAQDSQGGEGGRFVGTGARYNPTTDAWTEITMTGAPSPRLTSGVWTGEGLLLFGGYNGTHLNETWLYSPARTLYPYAKR